MNLVFKQLDGTIKEPDRHYTSEQGKRLKGKTVCCDEKGCDGKLCGGHNKFHVYDDENCFSSCCWPGHNGFCVEIK